MPHRCAIRGAAFAAPFLFWALGAGAASLDVNPVRIDIARSARSAELRLTNTASEELSVQIDVRAWSQDGGADELVETRELLAVPPLVTIPPGERQIVRIGHLATPSPDLEKSFRVIVTELPPNAGDSNGSALNMRLRLSIPVFVASGSGTAAPDVVLDGLERGTGDAVVTLRNAGKAHVKIDRVELRQRGEWSALPGEALSQIRYLLPNTSARLAIPQGLADAEAIRITSADRKEWEHAMALPQ
jgi:fimbrial chaperone protein